MALTEQQLSKLKRGEGQDRNVFYFLKKFLANLNDMTDEQLGQVHYEVWEEARLRAEGRTTIGDVREARKRLRAEEVAKGKKDDLVQ